MKYYLTFSSKYINSKICGIGRRRAEGPSSRMEQNDKKVGMCPALHCTLAYMSKLVNF